MIPAGPGIVEGDMHEDELGPRHRQFAPEPVDLGCVKTARRAVEAYEPVALLHKRVVCVLPDQSGVVRPAVVLHIMVAQHRMQGHPQFSGSGGEVIVLLACPGCYHVATVQEKLRTRGVDRVYRLIPHFVPPLVVADHRKRQPRAAENRPDPGAGQGGRDGAHQNRRRKRQSVAMQATLHLGSRSPWRTDISQYAASFPQWEARLFPGAPCRSTSHCPK